MADNLAIGDHFTRSGIEPFVGFGVPIGKAQNAGGIMQAGWIMEKHVLEHIDAKSGAANIGWVNIRKNESIRRLICRELRGFHVEPKPGKRHEWLFEAAGGRAHVTIQRVTAHIRHISSRVLDR